jgi:hypothetical protein
MEGGAELWASRVTDALTEEGEFEEQDYYSDTETAEVAASDITSSDDGHRYRHNQTWTGTHSKYYITEWPKFLRELQKKFGDPNPANTAITRLEQCRQGTRSVDEFVTEFDSIAAETGFNDEALIRYFQNGLNLGIFNQIWAMDTPPSDLEGWEEKARHFDRQRQMRDSIRHQTSHTTRP